MEYIAILCFILALAIIRIFLHYYDIDTVRTAARRRGWSQIKIEWAPFDAGAFFENGERCYRVYYVDEAGNKHRVYCKTSITTGLFWRE